MEKFKESLAPQAIPGVSLPYGSTAAPPGQANTRFHSPPGRKRPLPSVCRRGAYVHRGGFVMPGEEDPAPALIHSVISGHVYVHARILTIRFLGRYQLCRKQEQTAGRN